MFDIYRPYGTSAMHGVAFIYLYLAPIGACPVRDKILVVSMMRYIIKSRRDAIVFYRTILFYKQIIIFFYSRFLLQFIFP
jgi:hypothetical protein